MNPVEDRLRVHQSRNDLEQLRLRVAQVSGDLGHAVIVQLRGLLLLLRYRLTQLGDVRHRVRCLAFEPSGAAFKLQETGAGYQALIDQRLNAFDLFPG